MLGGGVAGFVVGGAVARGIAGGTALDGITTSIQNITLQILISKTFNLLNQYKKGVDSAVHGEFRPAGLM